MYNGIAVGLENGGSSTGPTGTDGRCKPDIVAPSSATSYATPYVSGSAAILIQAGTRGDGGNGTETSAVDPRAVKALLLNGALKPPGWTRQSSEPLDRHFGAGLLNVNRSHLQLSGGRHSPTISSNDIPGSAHLPPPGISGNVTSLSGWNFSTITHPFISDNYQDCADNYFFDLPSSQSGAYQAVCTLVWNRHNGQMNELDLFLYDANTNALVASSTSGVDNVEHLYLIDFPAGRYVLQVFKPLARAVSESETYALAFDFSPFTALESWRNDYFHTTASTGIAADQNDFDGDGLPNLVEYALGTDPVIASQAASAGTVEADGPNSYLTLTVNRVEVKPGVTYIVETGNDLAGWSQDVTVLENTPARLKVRDNTPLGTGIKRFMRLRVTAP